jgi:hypoxanthine phosphoribosyltransferase
MKTFDYAQRHGVERISWSRFADLTRTIVEALAKENIDLIIGIARAGLFPATASACMLRREFYPVRVTRRYKDEITYPSPVWRIDVPNIVKGLRVAIMDEIADSGETLAIVKSRSLEQGASHVVSACLVTHSWADPRPDITALSSDAFIIFPWDEKVFLDGKWQQHPEIKAGLNLQGKS